MQHPHIGTKLRMCSVSISRADAISRRDLVRLASSPIQAAVRVTGGAGHMPSEEGQGVADCLAQALGGATCGASVLAGATMVIERPIPRLCTDCDRAKMHCRLHAQNVVRHPGVMDILPRLAQLEAPGRTIGIVPTISPPVLYNGHLIISDTPGEPFYTVVDDTSPVCVLVQFNTDRPTLTWDDEWKVCLDYLQLLRDEGNHRSLHLVYNGGATTRREVMHVAQLSDSGNPWRVLLIEDSGREATTLANDLQWRRDHPNVISCTKADLDAVVREMGFAR